MTAKKTGRYDRKKNKLGMTVKKQAPGMTGREKRGRNDKRKQGKRRAVAGKGNSRIPGNFS